MRKNLHLILFFLVITLLSGCCAQFAACPRPMLICPPTRAQDFKTLKKAGVEIIKTCETYTVVIPSDLVFYPNSPNFRPDADKILEPLSRFLRCYETTMMRVGAFTASGCEARNKAMTEKQAQRIVAYLTEKCVDARILYAVGYGSCYPIGDNTLPSHRTWNRRIEIKFRTVVIPPLI